MSCSPASQTRANPTPVFHPQRGQRWRRLCHCLSAEKRERIWQTHLTGSNTPVQFSSHSSLIKIKTCANRKLLAVHSWSCHVLTCINKVTNIYVYQRETVPWTCFFYNLAAKVAPSKNILTQSISIISKVSHFAQSPYVLQNFLFVFQSAWRAQTAETCSSMRLFNFLRCRASWLQMARVCSGLTEPAVGVGQMLTSPAASVGETAPHSYRRWRADGWDTLFVADKQNEWFGYLLFKGAA